MRPVIGQASRQAGYTLIEVLVSMLVVTFGMLGMAGIMARTTVVEVEGIQRAQAALLLRDMTERIQLNRRDALAGLYGQGTSAIFAPVPTSGAGASGASTISDCSVAATRVARDLCEWRNVMAGANETQGGKATSALNGARGCITLAPGTTSSYTVTVVWRGMSPSGRITETCGTLDGEDRAFLRSITTVIELGRLDG
jgi:type IV pilus assembly protein PilV